jgi:hypothetical protein
MSTFACNYAQFRQVSSDFLKTIPTIGTDIDALDAGLKCVQLHYLGMDAAAEHEVAGAAALMRIVSVKYIEAEEYALRRRYASQP